MKSEKNRRHFRRYNNRHTARVRANGTTFDAEVLDYSLSGLRLFFEDIPSLRNGDLLKVESDELTYPTSGRVVWSRKVEDGLLAGLSRADKKGLIKHYMLSDVFNGLRRSLVTGVLKVRSGRVEKTVCVKNGDMVFASSSLGEDGLAEMLLREGSIRRKDYERSREISAQSGKLQGAVLIELGLLSPPELVQAVNRQVEEIIISLFDIPSGEIELSEGPLPKEESITLRLSIGNLIYRGVKRSFYIQRKVAALPPEAVLTFSDDPLNLYQDIAYDPEDRKILSLIDGKASLGVVISRSGLNEQAARKSIAALLSTSVIEVAGKEAARESAASERIFEPRSDRDVPAGLQRKIDELYAKHATLDHYSLLGLKSDAGESEIKRAFYGLTREFHPDKHFYLSDDMKGKLHAIFATATNAYKALSDPSKRREYDKSLSKKDAPAVTKGDIARNKFIQGNAEYGSGRFREAAQLFAHAAYLDPGVARYHLYHGLSLAGLNETREAEQAMRKAAEIEPSNDEVIAELGHLYLKMGFPVRAQGNFKRALKLNPSNARAKEGLSKVKI